MAKYAGQPMTTGAQAEIYANYFIGRHLFLIGGGKTYSQLSAESLAQPKNLALQGQVETVFKGTTLRSMLLEAYGFWQLGQIALIAAIAVLHRRRPDAGPVRPRVRPPAAHRPRSRDPAEGRHPRPGQRQLTPPTPHNPDPARPSPAREHRGRETFVATLVCRDRGSGPTSRSQVTVRTPGADRARTKLCMRFSPHQASVSKEQDK